MERKGEGRGGVVFLLSYSAADSRPDYRVPGPVTRMLTLTLIADLTPLSDVVEGSACVVVRVLVGVCVF